MSEQTFVLDGLHCQGCVETVSHALNSLSGVSAVSVDLHTEGTSTVRISTEIALSREQVQTALTNSGNFSVVG